LTDLETAERVLTRVSKTPPARKPTSAAATAKGATATQEQPRARQRHANPAHRA
jgi:hypothetical protein